MDWGGHVYPTFLKIDFLIRLNLMKKGWGRGNFWLLRDRHSFPFVYGCVQVIKIGVKLNFSAFSFMVSRSAFSSK